jgi:hypothetical protein
MLQSSNQILVQNGRSGIIFKKKLLCNFWSCKLFGRRFLGGGGVFPFLKPFFKKGLKKVLCLGFWHQHHEASHLNLKFKLMFMFLRSLCPKLFTLSSLTTQKFERIWRFNVPFELLVYI